MLIFSPHLSRCLCRALRQIQREYRKRRRAFDTLFKHKRRDEGGSSPIDGNASSSRLDASDANLLKDRMREGIKLR